MRIGVDTVCLAPPYTGIPNYVLNLLTALTERPDANVRTLTGYRLFNWHTVDRAFIDHCRRMARKTPEAAHLSLGAAGMAAQATSRVRRFVSRNPVLHRFATQALEWHFSATMPPRRLDVFHAFLSRPPGPDRGVPIVPVVYDLSFLKFPELHTTARITWMRSIAAICQDAPLVHTISRAVQVEIIAEFGRSASDVHVIEPGVNDLFLDPMIGNTDILDRLKLTPGRYALSVATLEPRKNFKTLVAAYAGLSPGERRGMPLVIVGGRGWGDTGLAGAIEPLLAEGTLHFTGYVSDFDLKTLYRSALALFYPSLYEGYGMPIAEALALGCPVVVSDSSSMPEAACGVGRLVAPLDIDGWRQELRRAADSNHGEVYQASLRSAVAHLTWERAAEKTVALYSALARQTG